MNTTLFSTLLIICAVRLLIALFSYFDRERLNWKDKGAAALFVIGILGTTWLAIHTLTRFL